MTIFGHFFSLSLLSYIEIYIEYSGNFKKKTIFAIVKLRKKFQKKSQYYWVHGDPQSKILRQNSKKIVILNTPIHLYME